MFETINLLNKLISFPTVSSESNLSLIEYTYDLLSKQGFTCSIQKSNCGIKANLIAVIGPKHVPGIVLSGHTDVVPVDGQLWTSDPFNPEIRSDRVYGRGACDMKGFIAAVLSSAAKINARALRVPIIVMLSYDEEVGCGGAKQLIGDLDKFVSAPPLVCIVGEPTQMRVVNAHKGICLMSTRFQGTPGHSSSQTSTVNSISEASKFVCFLNQVSAGKSTVCWDSRSIDNQPAPIHPDATVNVGMIRGGTAVNIVPEYTHLEWEFRYFSHDTKLELLQKVKNFCRVQEVQTNAEVGFNGLSVEFEIFSDLPPLLEDQALPDFISRIISDNVYTKVDYCTEAGLYQNYWKCPTIVCGPGSIEQAHKKDEYIELSQLQIAKCFIDTLIAKCYSSSFV